jgi:hypothetical protein
MVTLAVRSREPAPVSVERIASDSSEFVPQPNSCIMAISPGGKCYVPIVFTPNDVGKRTGLLTIATNSARTPTLTVRMRGYAKQGVIDISPQSLDFFDWPQSLSSGVQTVTISNRNPLPMAAPIVGLSGASFRISQNGCDKPLDSNVGVCVVSIVFAPSGTGAQTGALTIIDSAAKSPHTVRLRGVGTLGAALPPGVAAIQGSSAPPATPGTSSMPSATPAATAR